MMPINLKITATTALLAFLTTLSSMASSYGTESVIAAPVIKSACNFRTEMRKLWEDHITWTRLYFISTLSDLPDKEATKKRLLQNQKDIGDAIAPFYGKDAGQKLTNLLTEHISIAANIVSDIKRNDLTKIEDLAKKWSRNADDLATFIYNANQKNLVLADLKSRMNKHLLLTTDEVVARLKMDWDADVVAYDKVHQEVLEMSDMLAAGMIKQFSTTAH